MKTKTELKSPPDPARKPRPSLAELEREVVAESREWGRQRLAERLQQLAREEGQVFPLAQRKQRPLTLCSELGEIKLIVDYGQDRATGEWFCPVRRVWGLGPHQQITPAWAEKLAFTVTATGSYEEAAAVASCWGRATDDSTLHALVQRVGARACAQAQARYETLPKERQPQLAPSALAVALVDGCQVRERGPGWGKKKTKQDRVEWHELKLGVFYRHEQAARSESGRGLLTDKVVVSWLGEPLELSRRLHWEAQREGLGRAREILYLGDGAPWVWGLKADRFAAAHGLLDFYHASQHVWEVGRVVCGEAQPELSAWVQPRLHQLRHGREQTVLGGITRLKKRRGAAGKILAREQNYLASHAQRMNYQEMARRGWPIGSGAVESACRQKQCRFKRAGQFWTRPGLRHLAALDEARRNHHWEQLWQPT